jgi:L-amino acid N-acyltransferase YncA
MASILRLPMSDAAPSPSRALPRTVQLKDGTPVVLRLMTPADAAPIAAFARSLPEDDLLFLRMDITDPDAVAHWMRNLEAGLTTTVLAEAGGEIAGYAALVQNRVAWQRHLGEIRTQVALRFRSQGLGRALAGEIFGLARGRGLRKIVAQMTPDQKGAMVTFERLGFRPEALLQDFVVDHAGRTRDLVVMGYDVTGLTDHDD